ncbi:MAG: hypothetical protein ACRCTY_01540 [Candidatus Adiutrix sp.]
MPASKFKPKAWSLINRGQAIILTALAFFIMVGCAGASYAPRPRQEPVNYLRHITLVVEDKNFKPLAGAEVHITAIAPTRLLSPLNGRGRTDKNGHLKLIFQPLAQYQKKPLADEDLIVDFLTQAKLVIDGGLTFEIKIDDWQSFARYCDPLYQGLNRNLEGGETYFMVILP